MISPSNNYGFQGLTNAQVSDSRRTFGRNETAEKKYSLFDRLKALMGEPMIVLLLVASLLYFISGKTGDGMFMVFAIFLVTGISLYQESRSRHALDALKTLTKSACRVIREGAIQEIRREDIVIGDIIIVEEGTSVPADGIIIHSNDFAVNESILTGESLAVFKNADTETNRIFQGTTVVGGLAIARVDAIGSGTELGKIGKSIESIKEEETPLQRQVASFVGRMAAVGTVVFLIVWAINYFESYQLLDSLLKALTLAMSILPEEIPVAFTTFMALGAWRLMKVGIIVKQTKTVETLGSATVICTDKTGTITENRMTLAKVFVFIAGKQTGRPATQDEERELIELGMWSSEPIPFDPMEVALHEAYGKGAVLDRRPFFKLVREYPLGGRPPMMTHVFEDDAGTRLIAAKGAPEAVIAVSLLSADEKEIIEKALQSLSGEGFRVLGVATSDFKGDNFPDEQQQLPFTFRGLVAFYDPPKKNIQEVFESFYRAGIAVKIITGDNAATTTTIARQINFQGRENVLNGEALLRMSEEEVKEKVMSTNIFTRMFPDAKLRILNALKANGQIVAMTGDGVNDGPALKTAHIGIAMGKKGSEIAKEVSSLIITDDDLSRMVDAIAMGRKIYSNLKKAIQYIISIHIPIILTVFVPLALGWIYPAIFSPVHVIFLELIMGPTCSILYENEPMEKNIMFQKPRPFTSTFFSMQELGTSIVQGLVISAGTLFTYQFAVQHAFNEPVTRTMVFITLLTANVFLTLVNRSFYYSIFTTLGYRNKLVPLIIFITLALAASFLFVPPFTRFFEFERPDGFQFFISVLSGFASVTWFEGVKAVNRLRKS